MNAKILFSLLGEFFVWIQILVENSYFLYLNQSNKAFEVAWGCFYLILKHFHTRQFTVLALGGFDLDRCKFLAELS
jgi:hypothetical protein